MDIFLPPSQVPYDDLRYLFGEIMYGGHITDEWDRRLCRTYLEEFIKPEMLEGELSLAPGFQLPGNMDYSGYHQVRLCPVLEIVSLGNLGGPPICLHALQLTLQHAVGHGLQAESRKSCLKSSVSIIFILCPSL